MSEREQGRGRMILLVEDNETIRDAFAVLLEETGYSVAQAGSGREALATAREAHPDLILMDLGLPDMGGLEVTRSLKADPTTEGIIIVALTGRALEIDEQACRAAGCSGYLSKPIDTAQLLRSIERFLSQESPA